MKNLPIFVLAGAVLSAYNVGCSGRSAGLRTGADAHFADAFSDVILWGQDSGLGIGPDRDISDSTSALPDSGLATDGNAGSSDILPGISDGALQTNADAGAAEVIADAAGAQDSANVKLGYGLVSWWRGEGNALDSAGSNHGILQGGFAFVEGRIGQAFGFNGTDAALLVPNSPSLSLAQGFTVAFWMRVHSLPSKVLYLLRKTVPGYEDKNVGLDIDGTLAFYLFDVMYRTPVNYHAPLTVNTWHHVAATYDGTMAKLYFDGALRAALPASGTVMNSTGTLTFGHDPAFPFFDGALDEIMWYSRDLSEVEIAALASQGN